jgi:hypothetical protein
MVAAFVDVQHVIGLGGDLLVESQAFVGPMTVDATSRVRVRTCFLGAAAADERGVYVATDIERPTKQALMDIADEVILLADHAKFGTSDRCCSAPSTGSRRSHPTSSHHAKSVTDSRRRTFASSWRARAWIAETHHWEAR